MTITVHHLNNSRSHAATNLAPPELKQAHPLGKSPLIVQYLCERHGKAPGTRGSWLPDLATEDHVRHLEWMQFGESSFFVPVMLKLNAGRLGDAAAPLMPRIEQQLTGHIAFAEDNIRPSLHLRRRQLDRRRRDDELPRGDRGDAGLRREGAKARRLRRSGPRPSRLAARPRARRPLFRLVRA